MTDPEQRYDPEQRRLGHAVRGLRARHAITQEELGHRSGLHRNYVGAIERGEINPTFKTMLRLARGLEVRFTILATAYEDEPNPEPAGP